MRLRNGPEWKLRAVGQGRADPGEERVEPAQLKAISRGGGRQSG
ncbi:hypothetical protein ACIRJM_25960 [Streptomyces sp. NPDC102405]